MTATHDDHDDSDDNRRVCNVTSSFYFKNDGDNEGNRHHIKNDAVIMILSLSLITLPFGHNATGSQPRQPIAPSWTL